MTPAAQGIAWTLPYTPKQLGCLLEAVASAEGLAATELPMVAPRLPAATVKLLRESWERIEKESFGEEFLKRAMNEDIHHILNDKVARPEVIVQFIQLLLDLLDPESVPQLERVVHAAAALARQFGRLRMKHLVALKRCLTRTVVEVYTAPKAKRQTSRCWEAFFYCLAAVAAPHLTLTDSLTEFIAASAATLPMPAGGTQAAAVAAQGVALLEMCLGITAAQTDAKFKGESAPREVVTKLSEARGWLVESVRSDVNAYCGLLGFTYARMEPPRGEQGVEAEENEFRLWQRRATEVPLKVAEYSFGVANTCFKYRKQIIRSLENDWLAGAKLLNTAFEIALKNTESSLSFMGKDHRGDIEAQLARLRTQLNSSGKKVWQELCDV